LLLTPQWLNTLNNSLNCALHQWKPLGLQTQNNIDNIVDGLHHLGLFQLVEDDLEDWPEGIIEQYWDFMTDRLNKENYDEDDGETENDIDEDDY